MSVLLAHGEPFTVEDLFALPDNGMRQELLDGVLLVTPNPSTDHQDVCAGLWQVLKVASAGTAWRPVLGMGVLLPGGYLVPDLSVVTVESAERNRKGHQYAPEDLTLVIEVESPHGRRRDRVWKPQAYAEAGIPRYWRVVPDAEGGPEVVVHELVDGGYREVAVVAAGHPQQVEAPFPVTLDPGLLLD